MKNSFFILMMLCFVLFAFIKPNYKPHNKNMAEELINHKNISDTIQKLHFCLSAADAEKIIGQPVKLTDSAAEVKDNILRHRCTYTPAINDASALRPCNIYYLAEQYSDEAAAKKAYAVILQGNQNMVGLTKINNLGSEAFIHTDGANFDLLIFRKNNKMLRIKINKITSKTSLQQLQSVAQNIAATF